MSRLFYFHLFRSTLLAKVLDLWDFNSDAAFARVAF